MVDRFDYVGGSYPMAMRPNGEYVEYEDYAALEARVAELESRLEVDPAHHVDGISARNATIELQDAVIDELKARVAELEKDAARYRWLSLAVYGDEALADRFVDASMIREA